MNDASGRAPVLARREALGRPFAHLPRGAAAVILSLILAAMVWAAWAAAPARDSDPQYPAATTTAPDVSPRSNAGQGKGDMALYARIAARVAAGEGYYAAALGEQRAGNYPTRPFVAVRLPTLARVQAVIGTDGVRWLALALVAGAITALNWRGVPLASRTERIVASALLAAGGGAALSPVAGYDHDLIAGVLLTTALLAYRPHRWWPALIAAAAALAVRELAAPFVALWLAFALAGRRWHEAVAVAGVLAVLTTGMTLHAQMVEAARLPGDLASQGWSARAGYGLPLAALGELTGLRHLPATIAAPLAILPLVGWAAIGGRSGMFAALWFAGIATLMALFARPANYYWAELALPAYGIGLAFAPRALVELVRAALRQT